MESEDVVIIAISLMFILFIGFVSSGFATIRLTDGLILNRYPYEANGGPARMLTVQTPNGNQNFTVTCTFYDTAKTLPLMGSSVGLFSWAITPYHWGPNIRAFPRGC